VDKQKRLRGHFDGSQVVLDEPIPAGLKPNAPVEIVIPGAREQALQELKRFLAELWNRPLPAGSPPAPRRWKREDLHERGS
jgi:hypothetical protein